MRAKKKALACSDASQMEEKSSSERDKPSCVALVEGEQFSESLSDDLSELRLSEYSRGGVTRKKGKT